MRRFIEKDTYSKTGDLFYEGPDGWTIKRVPLEGSLYGYWCLLNDRNEIVDTDQFRHDLAERHEIELVY